MIPSCLCQVPRGTLFVRWWVLSPFYFGSALTSPKPRGPLKDSQLDHTDDAQVASTYPGPDASLPLVFFLLWVFEDRGTRQALSLLDLCFLFPVRDENTELRLLCRLSILVWCQQSVLALTEAMDTLGSQSVGPQPARGDEQGTHLFLSTRI